MSKIFAIIADVIALKIRIENALEYIHFILYPSSFNIELFPYFMDL